MEQQKELSTFSRVFALFIFVVSTLSVMPVMLMIYSQIVFSTEADSIYAVLICSFVVFCFIVTHIAAFHWWKHVGLFKR